MLVEGAFAPPLRSPLPMASSPNDLSNAGPVAALEDDRLALPGSAGAEFRAPMAIAVIGGLLFSTMLSMLFVPSLFSMIHGLQTTLGRWFGRRTGRPGRGGAAAEGEPLAPLLLERPVRPAE